MIPLLLASAALAQPQALVAMGDGLVAVPPAEAAKATTAGGAPVAGWVSALADCLEEQTPGRWSVVDRAVEGDTAASARRRVPAVRELAPRLVLVGVGARELADANADAAAFRAEVQGLLGDLRVGAAPQVVLVGIIPPTLAQLGADAASQATADARTEAWNGVLAEIAGGAAGVRHVDLWTDWPRAADERGRLTIEGWRLSPQGHSRVAAAVCDAVLAGDREAGGK